MIKIESLLLPPDTQRELDQLQGEVNSLPTFTEKVKTAKDRFSARNKPQDRTFRVVRQVLTEMCSGAARCGYCEDSEIDQVEHIRPKSWYPEFVFVWENYLYACGKCNREKNNKYALVDSAGRRLPLRPNEPPPDGNPLFIDPRREDPMAFMEVDLLGTFYVQALYGLSGLAKARAEYTINTLSFNREALPKARKTAYRLYSSALKTYIRERDALAKETIQSAPHFSVWREMQRSHARIPELNTLFSQASEALQW